MRNWRTQRAHCEAVLLRYRRLSNLPLVRIGRQKASAI
jgi:hypothetical protein